MPDSLPLHLISYYLLLTQSADSFTAENEIKDLSLKNKQTYRCVYLLIGLSGWRCDFLCRLHKGILSHKVLVVGEC